MSIRRILILSLITALFSLSSLSWGVDRAGDVDRSAAVRSWQEMKFGLFIHWGLYSVAGGVWKGEKVETGYSEQIMAWVGASPAEYAELASGFTAEKWDPDALCELAKSAGMRYIVLTAKHHDGFCLFKTGTTRFNSVEMTPAGRDLVRGLAEACSRHGLKLGLYYSLIDWSHPEGNTPEPAYNSNPITPGLEKDSLIQLEELLTGYGNLVELWFDMSTPTYRQSRLYADTVRRIQPGCLVSGRVWNHQGDFTVMGDNQIPGLGIREPWQSPESIYRETWGYRSWQDRSDLEGKIGEKIRHLSRVVSLGGVFLLNIGPRGDGSVVEFEAEVLKGVGKWLKVHEAAVMGTESQPFYEQLPWGYAVTRENSIYLHVHTPPRDGKLRLPGLQGDVRSAGLMSGGRELAFSQESGTWEIDFRDPEMRWPVEVVAVEMEAPPLVLPPYPSQVFEEHLRIPHVEAYTRYDRNGKGYFEQRKASGYTWDFSVPASGTYELQVEVFRPEQEISIEMIFNGEASVHALRPDEARRDIILVSTGPFALAADVPCSLTVQAPDYIPGKPVGAFPAGLRIVRSRPAAP